MKVWCVWKECPTLDAVDDELALYDTGWTELLAIFDTEDKANALVRKLDAENEDPEPEKIEDEDGDEWNGPREYYVAYSVSEWEVQ